MLIVSAHREAVGPRWAEKMGHAVTLIGQPAQGRLRTGHFLYDSGTNALGPTALSDVAVVTATDNRRSETVLATAACEVNAQFARLAYDTDETGEKDHFCTTNS